MRFHLHIDPVTRLVQKKFVGELGLDDLVRSLQVETDHPDWAPGCACLCDLSEASVRSVEAGDVRTFVATLRTHRQVYSGGRWAILAPTDLEYGMARMYLVLAEELGVEQEVFRSRREALDWLGGVALESSDPWGAAP
jgi:hypothetical protein